jgi:VanZ family protein
MALNSFSKHLYKYFQKYPVYLIYIPLFIYWIILFTATTIPTDKLPQLFPSQDKLEHFVAYAVLAFLLALALHFQKKSVLLSSKMYVFTLLFVLTYGAIDEIHQLFVPGRYCDLLDWCADSIGGLIGILFANLFLKAQYNKSENLLHGKA